MKFKAKFFVTSGLVASIAPVVIVASCSSENKQTLATSFTKLYINQWQEVKNKSVKTKTQFEIEKAIDKIILNQDSQLLQKVNKLMINTYKLLPVINTEINSGSFDYAKSFKVGDANSYKDVLNLLKEMMQKAEDILLDNEN
ncbi:hypothetical protein [Mycoplasma sp. 4423]